jgi:hypothetical protein
MAAGCRVVVTDRLARLTRHRCSTGTSWPLLSALCLILSAFSLAACADTEKERLISTTRPAYDEATGKLIEITYDANRNGRIDTWTEMDGTRPLRSKIDRNEDGKLDRWEYYDERGALAKLGFSRHDDGKPDAWAFASADGRVHRIEISSSGDNSRIDRWEYYDSPNGDPVGHGALVRAEEDTDNDGRPDKWETYEGGAIGTVAFDENGDGVPDRRLRYRGSQFVAIESLADRVDGAGRMSRR